MMRSWAVALSMGLLDERATAALPRAERLRAEPNAGVHAAMQNGVLCRIQWVPPTLSRMPQNPNVDTAVRYHEAVSHGATGEELARFFHEDAVQQEFPNLLFPDGVRRDLPAVLQAAERGRKVLSHQRFEVHHTVADGDQVALEVTWTGTLATPLGDLPAGHELRARIAVFLEFRDGRIYSQRNYDCYERPDHLK